MNSTKRILIVDDEIEICESLQEYLSDLGDIQIACDGQEALERIENEHFDLMISDYRMPRMDGLILVKVMSAKQIDCPVIFMTGNGDATVQMECLSQGLFEYFQKPFKVDVLRAIALNCLNGS